MSPITVLCPKCGREGKLPEDVKTLPKRVRCPGCQSEFHPVAANPDEFTVVPSASEQLGELAKKAVSGVGEKVKEAAKRASDYAKSDGAKAAMDRAWRTAEEVGGKAKDAATALRGNSTPWWENPLVIGGAIFFFFPVGLFLLWKHPTLRHNKMWWWAGGVWSFFVIVGAMIGDNDRTKSLHANREGESQKPAFHDEFVDSSQKQNGEVDDNFRTLEPEEIERLGPQ